MLLSAKTDYTAVISKTHVPQLYYQLNTCFTLLLSAQRTDPHYCTAKSLLTDIAFFYL